MATITPVLKIRNKKKEDNPLRVMFRHGKVEVVVSTSESIKVEELQKGKIVGEKAIALNELVAKIGSDLQKAHDIILKRGDEITSTSIREEYERITSDRRMAELLAKPDEYAKNQRINQGTKAISKLEKEISERKEAIALHERRLAELTGNITRSDKSQLLVSYIEKYLEEKKNNHKNNTRNSYYAIIKILNGYNKKLKITDVDRRVMYEIEDYMIKLQHSNSTIENYTSKTKGILNYYGIELGLSQSYKQYKFKLPLYQNEVLYFSPQQLVDFWNHKKEAKIYDKIPGRVVQKNWQRIKDIMMFMCGTSLRFIDCFEDFRDTIQTTNGAEGKKTEKIVLRPSKTTKYDVEIQIPLTPLVKSILVRNDYKFKKIEDYYFRDLLREFCEDIPSFQHVVNRHYYIGQTKHTDKNKYFKEIGAHTGRRTFINFAFQSGWTIPEISGCTGHLEVNTLMLYASKVKQTQTNPMQLFHTLDDNF
ncbi:phage integrase SAM-like domain-containing protein [Hymenobacter aerilatus]|uniref:Phage integrase SAM-like domain-containing protein n=1 Tax=Hymenobacter aerilatus TaxID=2932251 RepID=A0A8T9T3B4_9BACT|nr:phage integrase SAM-like domain-containing protein [Hymenobacter aerilatus]UOR07463.1 phage integrase SAM-like domain-containing protein [Hymenobacter aerilatus]